MPSGTPLEVLLAFARLGIASFGGPIAHLGYFRAEFVERRRWLDERSYADIVALCQFLPGPASSQTGFAIGLLRAGGWGGLAAWTGFTLPSAALMLLFAYGAGPLAEGRLGAGLLHGLKLVAVAIVAQAVMGMARSLCPDRPRAAIGAAAAVLVLLAPGSVAQLGAIVLGALAGLALGRDGADPVAAPLAVPVPRPLGAVVLAVFALLLGLSLVPGAAGPPALAQAFYRSGALVFGGGHVVLPLLRDAVVAPGWLSDDAFLAGYGAAQAVPGPLFTVAAYLGAVATPMPGPGGAALALVAIFLPGLLLLTGTLPFWSALAARPRARAAMRGINAAVVGILGAALYDPVWTSAVHARADAAVALVAFLLLTRWQQPPWVAVIFCGGAGMALA